MWQPPASIALHPRVLARYEGMIAKLADALNLGLSSGQGDVHAIVRELVETVTINRDPTGSP